ncbi:MAG: hypothetical protein ABFC84_02015 [Veillonellales bacterium]
MKTYDCQVADSTKNCNSTRGLTSGAVFAAFARGRLKEALPCPRQDAAETWVLLL